jgi:exosortase
MLQVFGTVGDIQLFTHVAIFSTIALSIALLIGWPATKLIPFPLAFILLAIPVGEELIPYLQEIAANGSVTLLKLTGIPVFRNGLYIDIPAGKFLVAEACSGISFFISSIAFGSLYAHLSYQTNRAKILFFIFAAIIPILANSVRVYGIILIAHYSDMEYAVGADHLIYGWVFYCIVLALIYFFGEMFRKPFNEALDKDPMKYSWGLQQFIRPLLVLSVVFSIAAIWQYKVTQPTATQLDQQTFKPLSNSQTDDLAMWGITYPNNTPEVRLVYSTELANFEIFAAKYTNDTSQGELISSRNRNFNIERWSFADNINLDLSQFPDIPKDVKAIHIVSDKADDRVIVHWYGIGDFVTSSKLKAKLYSTYQKFVGNEPVEYVFACSIKDQKELSASLVNECHKIAKTIL